MKRFWELRRKEAQRAVADAATRLMPTAAAADEKLIVTLPGGHRQEFALAKSSIAIGRAAVNDIVLTDSSVSRRHARVERSAHGCEVVDLGAANGLSVNGVNVARALLKPGDVIGIGDCSFRFVRGMEDRSPQMTRIDNERELSAAIDETPLDVNLEETTVPRVVILTAAKTWEVKFPGDELTIGRDANNDVVIDSDSVSRHHAVIQRHNGAFVVRDLRSGNGTWIHDQKISHQAIDDGTTVRIGSARLVFKVGFETDDLAAVEPGWRPAAQRRPVVVVPGFAGSTLWRGSEQIWPTRTALTQIELMNLDHELDARGLVNELVIIPNLVKQDQYSTLTNYLKDSLKYETGKDLIEFAYDFRQDNRVSAKRLSAAIDAWHVRAPITIIAHSMGCLVTRYFLECLGGKSKVDRVIFLGGPHVGTPYAFSSLLSGPNLLPLGLMNARLRDVLATYPSWYQILPTYPFVSDQRAPFNVLTDETWLPEASRPLLQDARRFRAELGTHCSVPSVCVFGYDIKTITAVNVERDPRGPCHKAEFVVTQRGDGTIPEVSSVLEGSEIHPVRQHHGSLFSDTDVKMRLKLELARGA